MNAFELGCFLAAVAITFGILAVIADTWERRDARQRNRFQARRVR